MGGIFISYRRGDTGPYAGRLRDRLSSHFGAEQVFRDLDRISPGERFPRAIERALGSCDALIALVGPSWSTVTDENGRRRLDDPKDYLRIEIAAALARDDVLVIPVLVGSTPMPRPEDLPGPMVALSECNALRLTDEGWDDQVSRLIRALEEVVQTAPSPSPPSPSSPPPPDWRELQQPAPWTTRPPPAAAPVPRRRGWGLPVGLLVGLVVVVLLAGLAVLAFKAVSGVISDVGPGNPTVVISPTSGPPGTTVNVTGTGYAKEETVVIRFHATEVGTTLTGADGSFTATVKIPATPFRNQQFDIVASGKSSIRTDSAPFMVR